MDHLKDQNHRVQIIRRDIEDNDSLFVSDIELSLPIPSYTINTLVNLILRFVAQRVLDLYNAAYACLALLPEDAINYSVSKSTSNSSFQELYTYPSISDSARSVIS